SCHPDVCFYCVDPVWPGLSILHHLAHSRSAKVFPRTVRPVGWLWTLRFVFVALFAVLGVVADQVRAWFRARESLGRLRDLGRNVHAEPRIWCVLAADLERANRHVIESVVRPALGTAQPLGVLLAGNLLRGRRSEVNMREHAGAELWSGLRTMQA